MAKSDAPPVREIREVGIESTTGTNDGEGSVKPGDRVLVDIFDGERFVDIIGKSKGRGFAGVVRRHGFGGGPKSHGHMFQIQGSIGASSFPSRVFPGQRMPGHFGRGCCARPAGWLRDDLEVKGAAEGASWLCWCRHARSAEGFEEGSAEQEEVSREAATCIVCGVRHRLTRLQDDIRK